MEPYDVNNAKQMQIRYLNEKNRVFNEFDTGKIPLGVYLRDIRRNSSLQDAWSIVERHESTPSRVSEGQLETALRIIKTSGYSVLR